ncbi:MAG: protein kinase [Polyangiaceae bacterium]|nr:protein kinase [Polyangiaceae bacterium]
MDAPTLRPGDTLGRYELLARIAAGGMAEVWLARATGAVGFRKRVVLKTILPHLVQDPEFVRMFVNEAHVASGLDHPNIVQIFDLGEQKGIHYIAMERVAGRSMRQILDACRARKRPVPPWFVLHAMNAACEGLQYAHELRDAAGNLLGLVHRDVSPENIMVSFTGAVKVLDFGVAKTTLAREQTQAGSVKGTCSYMAPEVLEGRLARRADVCALGVVLYELLTSHRPFRGRTVIQLMWHITNTDPTPPRELVPSIAPELEQTIMQALARDPDRRFAEVAHLQRRLEEHIEAQGLRRSAREAGVFLRELFPDDPEAAAAGPIASEGDGTAPSSSAFSPAPPWSSPASARPSPASARPSPASARPSPAPTLASAQSRTPTGLMLEEPILEPAPERTLAGEEHRAGVPDLPSTRRSVWSPPPREQERGASPSSSAHSEARRAARTRSAAPQTLTPGEAGQLAASHRTAELAGWGLEDQVPTSVSERHARATFAPAPRPAAATPAHPSPAEAAHESGRGVDATSGAPGRAPHGAPGAGEPAPPEEPSARADSAAQASAHFERGLACVRRGLHEDALREWELAAKLDPENRDYEFNLRRLRKRAAGGAP